jgi:hypothetical protein
MGASPPPIGLVTYVRSPPNRVIPVSGNELALSDPLWTFGYWLRSPHLCGPISL